MIVAPSFLHGGFMARPAHALFSASGSYKWLNCAAALAYEAGRPDEQSEAALQGTMMHRVGECCLLNRVRPLVEGVEGGKEASFFIDTYPLATPADGKAGPQFGEELVAPVDAYVDAVWSAYTSHRRNLLFIEQRVNYSIYIGQPLSYGTGDAIVLRWVPSVKAYRLEVHDFKGGIGYRVEADENPQLMLYALGAYRRLSKKYKIDSIVLFIHQGRVTEVASEWEVTIEGLLTFADYAKDRAADARALIGIPVTELKPEHFNPTEEGCRWCKGRNDCKAFSKYISNAARGGFPELPGGEATLTDADLAIIAKHMPEMKRYLSAMEAKLKTTDVPGFKMVIDRYGARSWKNEKRAIKILSRAGMDAKQVYLTPAQAEKALKKQPDVWAKLKGLIEVGEPSLALVDRRDPRPAYAVAKKTDFEIEE